MDRMAAIPFDEKWSTSRSFAGLPEFRRQWSFHDTRRNASLRQAAWESTGRWARRLLPRSACQAQVASVGPAGYDSPRRIDPMIPPSAFNAFPAGVLPRGNRAAAPGAQRYGSFLVALVAAALVMVDPLASGQTAPTVPSPEPRRPADQADLRRWLENMIAYHRYTTDEVCRATGLTADQVLAAQRQFGIAPGSRPERPPDAPLVMLPYPGGRHPRIGFLEGAVAPQRDTKVSVFTPWDADSYVVVDVPEAIWSNLGLTYLAHTHIPTVWTAQGISLQPLEWQRENDHTLSMERKLPNGIVFGTRAVAHRDHVKMSMWLTNHSDQPLSDLRVQNCVLLKGAKGFAQQTNQNKHFAPPYVACRSNSGDRWIITAWEPLHRAWANEPCPCLHSDPQFPDCQPGQTVHVEGWLSFYEGSDIEDELARIDAIRKAGP
jgi:hypothetical protein